MASILRGRTRLVGVISVALGCPFEGDIDPGIVIDDASRFAELGVELVAIGDTSGFGTPGTVRRLFYRLSDAVPEVDAVAHFHNNRERRFFNHSAPLRPEDD